MSNLGRNHISLNISLPKGTIIATLESVEDEFYLNVLELTNTTKETQPTFSSQKNKLDESEVEEECEEAFPYDLDLSGTKCSNLELKLLRKLISKYSDVLQKTLKALTQQKE